MIGLIDSPTQGEIILFGESVQKMNETERTLFRRGKIGFVFQKFNLIDSLTVYENVELPLLYMRKSRSEREKKVNQVLERLNIIHRAKHFPSQLSGGQQQRTAVARCIVTNPDLILADEPTGNLDSENGQEVMMMLTELNKEGKTIVLVTHDNNYAMMANSTVNMFDGLISEKDTDWVSHA